jgi:hypothetical protein
MPKITILLKLGGNRYFESTKLFWKNLKLTEP